MARLQILQLPEGASDDRPPFALVIDQVEPTIGPFGDEEPLPLPGGLAEKIGARAVLVFNTTIDIPTNEIPVGPGGLVPLRVQVEGDFEKFRQQVQDEASAASQTLAHARQATAEEAQPRRHPAIDAWGNAYDRAANALTRLDLCRQALINDGYFKPDEIGDDIAPRITEWLSHHRGLLDEEQRLSADLRERLKATSDAASAADTRLYTQKKALTDALGMDRLRDWDDIVNAARGLRKERDRLLAGADAVRSLHRWVESPHPSSPGIICTECSGYDGDGSCDNSPITHPCATITALNTQPDAGEKGQGNG